MRAPERIKVHGFAGPFLQYRGTLYRYTRRRYVKGWTILYDKEGKMIKKQRMVKQFIYIKV